MTYQTTSETAASPKTPTIRIGQLAKEYAGKRLPLQVLQSAAGFYIGTSDELGPVSRESAEYFRKRSSAELALERNEWTQRDHP